MEQAINKLYEAMKEIRELNLTKEEKYKLSSELSDFLCEIPSDLLVIPNWFSQQHIKDICNISEEEDVSDIMCEISNRINPDEISEQILDVYYELKEEEND